MRRKPATIICDAARSCATSSQAGDWHDVSGHHRYYGSSATNGGERIDGSARLNPGDRLGVGRVELLVERG